MSHFLESILWVFLGPTLAPYPDRPQPNSEIKSSDFNKKLQGGAKMAA